jgi:MFS superfamily sulfate permease-like transporter
MAKLAPTAFSMFVVILAQSAATSRAYAARYNERFSENTDLVGLGVADIGAGLSGTFVVNGSPTKTQMFDSAGGRTQLSLLVMAAVVLMVLLFLTAPLAYMPEAVLSAIVFLIGIDLIDLEGMHRIWIERRSEFWVALITAATVVLVGVEQGILLAIVLSLIDHTRRGYAPKNVVFVPGETGGWRPQPWALRSAGCTRPDYLPLYAQYVLRECPTNNGGNHASGKHRDPPLRWLCIDASAVDDVDYSAAETIRSLHGVLKGKGIRLVIAHVLEDVEAESRYHMLELFGEGTFYARWEKWLRTIRVKNDSDNT